MNRFHDRALPLAAIVALATLAPATAAAQQEAAVVSGRVTGETSQPLGAATVAIRALNIGTQTDDNGAYRLVVPAARVRGQQVALEVRRVGYKPQTRLITLTSGAITQNFQLETNPLRLGEVVITGAGTLSSTEKLGNSRSSVDSSQITRSNEMNIVQALAAKAPGVQVNAQSGQPGASSGIQIRGVKSILGNGQPLFIVDGQPIDNRTQSTQGFLGGTDTPNRASDINPNDIESIEILKGASAAAIYGARAAAGVVLITTKSGRGGPTRFTFKTTYATDDVLGTVPLQRRFGQGTGGATTIPAGTLTSALGTGSAVSFGPELSQLETILKTQTFRSASCDEACATALFNARYPNGIRAYDQFHSVFEGGSTVDNVLTISGGNERTTFYMSGGLANAAGVVVGDNDKYRRTTVRLNASHRVIENLTLKANMSYVDVNGAFVQRGSNVSGLLLGALRTPPEFNNRQYLDTNGLHRAYRFPNPTPAQLAVSRGFDNPVYSAIATQLSNNVGRAYGNVQAAYDPLSWLRVNYQLGSDYSADERLLTFPIGASTNGGAGQVYRTTINTHEIDHNLTATATRDLGANFAGTLTLGQNLNQRKFNPIINQGDNLIENGTDRLPNTVGRQVPVDSTVTVRGESYFGQATLDVYDQVFLTAALRNDGNSAYGQNNLRAWFPKASAAWNFLKGDGTSTWGWQDALRTGGYLTFGKLRFSYGEAGIEPQAYLLNPRYNPGVNWTDGGWGPLVNATQAGQGGAGLSAQRAQPNIRTERTKEWEYGFDLGLFRDRADLQYTRYTSRSNDVIFLAQVAPSTGTTTQAQNAALIRNRGVEIALNTRPIRSGRFEVDLNANWSFNDNNVLELSTPFININGSFAGNESVVARHGRVGMIAGNDFVRCGRGLTVNNVAIDATAGHCQGAPEGALYIGANGFPITDGTRRIVGDPQPDWIAGFNTAVRYGNWSLSGFVDMRKGGDIWNGTRGSLVAYGTAKETEIRGQTRTFGTDFYEQPVAGPGAGRTVVIDEAWFGGIGGGFGTVNKQFIEDGSFVRLREISIGYTWDNAVIKGLGFGSVDFRASGRNLGLWTDYMGIDPETNLGGAEVAARGIDFFNMPLTRSYAFSVSLNR